MEKLIAEVGRAVSEMTMKQVLSELNELGYSTFNLKWSKEGKLINEKGYEKFLEKNTSKIIESFKCRAICVGGLDRNTIYIMVGNKLMETFSFNDYDTKEDMDSEIRGFLERLLVEKEMQLHEKLQMFCQV